MAGEATTSEAAAGSAGTPARGRLSRAAASYLRTTVSERAQEAPADANAATAFSLGWQMAEVYRLGSRPPDSATATEGVTALTLGPLSSSLAGEIGVAQLQATLMKLREPIAQAGVEMPELRLLAEARSMGIDPAHWHRLAQDVHWAILAALHATDQRLSKAYELGRALADTCRAPRDGAELAAMLAPHRVTVLAGWLAGLVSVLPAHSARSVRISLERWGAWAAAGGPDPEAGALGRLHRQGELWQGLLAGDVQAEDLLATRDYVAVNARVNRRTREMLAGLFRVFWAAVMAVVALVAGSLVLIIEVKNAASGVAGAVGVVSALGLSVKGVGIVSEVRAPLIDREIDVAVAEAITLVPVRADERR